MYRMFILSAALLHDITNSIVNMFWCVVCLVSMIMIAVMMMMMMMMMITTTTTMMMMMIHHERDEEEVHDEGLRDRDD